MNLQAWCVHGGETLGLREGTTKTEMSKRKCLEIEGEPS